MSRTYRTALSLSGGNALASWQAGAFAALAARGCAPDRLSGASAGAFNAAVIAGAPPERAVERLRAIWSAAPAPTWWPAEADAWRRSAAVAATVATGHPGLFAPRPFLGQPWAWGGDAPPSLYDTEPMRRTLGDAVDWARVNGDGPRLQITAVDLETGEDALFDSARERLGPDHVRASAALMPAFPPVEIGGRWYVDPGLSANLPLDALLAEPGAEPLLVIALDLLPVAAPRPATIGEAAGRLQDLAFARQSARTIDGWRAVYDLLGDRAPAVTLARLSYYDQSREVAGKPFDFSPESAAQRWEMGRAAADAFLDALDAGRIAIGRPGLTVYRGDDPEPPAPAFRVRTSGTAG